MAPRKTSSKRTLKMEGPLTFPAVARSSQLLAEALKDAAALTVDLTSITAIDLSGAQLLFAAARSAQAAGVDFRITGAERYRKICEFAGLRPTAVADTAPVAAVDTAGEEL